MAYFFVIIAVVVADQLSKAWVMGSFQLYEYREVIQGFFNLVYVTNTGAAFSMLADVDSPWRHRFFLTIGLLAIGGLTLTYYKLRKSNPLYFLPIAFIVGGAIGNLVDRVRFGAVVDFLDFYVGNYHWPAFNVADSFICVGAFLFILLNILDSKKENLSK